MILSLFRNNLTLTRRKIILAASLYFSTLLFAILPVVMGVLLLRDVFNGSMALSMLTQDFDYTIYSDFRNVHGERFLPLLVQVCVISLVYFFVQTILSGGIIASINDKEIPLSLRSLMGLALRNAWRFIRLQVIVCAVLLFIVGLMLAVFGIVFTVFSEGAISEKPVIIAGGVSVFMSVIILAVLLSIMDYARTILIVHDCKASTAFGKAIFFVFRNFTAVVRLEFFFYFSLAVLSAAYLFLDALIGMTSNMTIIFMALIQQSYVGARFFLRIAGFGARIDLYEIRKPVEVVEEASVRTSEIPTEDTVASELRDEIVPLIEPQDEESLHRDSTTTSNDR